jgi:transposase
MSRLHVHLSPAERGELTRLRDHAPKPYVRERAAAVLKVADGWSCRRVAAAGLLRPRDEETVAAWVRRYAAEGAAGLPVRPGRGRKPAFSPRRPDRGRRGG